MEIIGTAATLLSGWLLYRKGKAREKKSAAV
jgi:hypothetical protein